MSLSPENLQDFKARLDEEIAAACDASDASPLERFVAEALSSDDAKIKGLVDKVWVVSLPDARKAIAAVAAWNARTEGPTTQPTEAWREAVANAVWNDLGEAGAIMHGIVAIEWRRVRAAILAALPPAPAGVGELVEAAREIDRFFLVIESSVRTTEGHHSNYPAVLSALKANRQALSAFTHRQGEETLPTTEGGAT